MTLHGSISLKRRVFRAGAWSLFGYGISAALRFGSNLLMTRLLAPEMFGVMSIAITVMVGLAMFSDVGLKQNVVQSGRGKEPLFLNTAWVTQIVRGFVLWFLAVVVALLLTAANQGGLLASWSIYASPELPYVIVVAAMTAVLAGFESTKLFEASRGLSLGRVTSIDIIAQLVGLGCMLAWVVVDRSIWVLVAGGIASGVARAILSHVWLSGTPNRFVWDPSSFSEIVKFGRWIFLSSILGFFVLNGDRLQIAGFVDGRVFGVYVIAALTYGAVEQVLTKIISDVSFPALSEVVRERDRELKAKYYQFRLLISSFANVVVGVLVVSGSALVATLYDERYAQAGWMLQALALCLLVTPFQVTAQALVALGYSKVLSNLAMVRFIALFMFLPIGFYLGDIQGAIFGIVLSRASTLPLTFYYKAKHHLLDLWIEVGLLLPIGLGVLIGVGLNQLLAK
jgi:O-antigen/teichoic acid export membrane protein